jgi:hypothetical protein
VDRLISQGGIKWTLNEFFFFFYIGVFPETPKILVCHEIMRHPAFDLQVEIKLNFVRPRSTRKNHLLNCRHFSQDQENLQIVYNSHGQPKSARGPHFRKIAILRAKILIFSKDLIDFAPKQRFLEFVEGPH